MKEGWELEKGLMFPVLSPSLKENKMQFKLVPFFLFLLLTACGDSKPLDERFYGTWVDPSGGTEPVVFREDDTVSWFGEEGTFDTYRYSRTTCGPHGYGYCPFDHGHGLEVSVSGNTHKIRPDFESYLNSWLLYPNGDTIYQTVPDWNGPGDPVVLLQAGTFESPLMSADFSKLGAGWGIPGNSNYHGSCPYFQCNMTAGALVYSADPLLASHWWGWGLLYAYNESSDRWESALQSDSPDSVVHGRDSVVVGREVIVQEVFVHLSHNRWKVDHLRASFDNGATWNTLPPLEFTYSNGDWQVYPDGNSSGWATPPTIKLAGSVLIQLLDVTPESDDYWEDDRVYEVWTLDPAADSPSWSLRSSFAFSFGYPDIYTHPTTGTIVLYTEYSEENQTRISHDYGVTWGSFEHPCFDPYYPRPILAHEQGFLCHNEGQEVYWYNSTTDTWTTHDVNFDEFVTPGDPTDGAYIRRGNQVIKWQPGGTETVVTTLSESLGYGDITVFDDQVIVNKFGMWRVWR
jgi:hypothetical protein